MLVEKPLTDRLRFEFDFAGSAGINGVSFIDSELRLACGFLLSRRCKAEAILGWRGLWFRRHDSQVQEQNDPNLRFGWLSTDPWAGLMLGLRVSY